MVIGNKSSIYRDASNIETLLYSEGGTKMPKIIVVGFYGEGRTVSDGQINKVRDYYKYISAHFGNNLVRGVDIGKYKQRPCSTFFDLLKSFLWCNKTVLLLTGDGNGIKTIFPFINRFSKIIHKELLFSVVGGGLLNNIDSKPSLIRRLKMVGAVYVETKIMKEELEKRGLTNIYYAPVFSKRKGIETDDVIDNFHEPLRICTYARVIKEKGISDAIDAVIEVNKRLGRLACILDIYGNPVGDYADEFNKKLEIAGDCIKCNPLLDDTNAINELSKHYLLLFPTYYEGEGFPIALIESMKAGLPVIATDWHFNSEIIDDGRTGVIYKRDGVVNLSDIILELISDKERVLNMRIECVNESKKYDPNEILNDLYVRLEK